MGEGEEVGDCRGVGLHWLVDTAGWWIAIYTLPVIIKINNDILWLGHVFIRGVKQYIIRFTALLMNSHELIIIVYIFETRVLRKRAGQHAYSNVFHDSNS